jgi:hypothetical protein
MRASDSTGSFLRGGCPEASGHNFIDTQEHR